ncbi:hypothetical protein [Roseovarius atlanticus]|uniref:hypothetical protein n=1 Tax=Roseovarius atlanticus TaxID=1641875 RepID=UPI001C93F62C|nr:hypothetical protein [Roseovarius atlanticus]MBY5986387.1 hypothetical protein [Roseovarius atlanticus]MBY6125027.1 hypothetical protein [Roseovarius atlanticus]MBY6150512.1 hypothetical protein [Roseovarius atlanticus]
MRPLSLTCLAVLSLAPMALANDRPPPRENDPDDFVRYIFEINACVLTEAQLLQIYQDAGHGLMGANNAVIAVSNREDIEVLDRNPFRYRYYGSDYCSF